MGESQAAGMLLVTGPCKAALDQQGWASRHCLDLLVNALEVWPDVGHHVSLHQVNQVLLQSTASVGMMNMSCWERWPMPHSTYATAKHV